MSGVLSLVGLLRRHENEAAAALEDRMARETQAYRRWEYYRPDMQELREVSGDERLRRLRSTLEALYEHFPPSQHQREFHDAFLNACLGQIYGKDLNKHLIRILRALRTDRLQSEVMICTPRRFGKTMAVVLYIAAWLLSQPDADACIYSIAGRTSNMFSAQVFNAIVTLLGNADRVKTFNQETLVVVNDYGGTSVMHAYPSNSKIRPLPPRDRGAARALNPSFSPRRVRYARELHKAPLYLWGGARAYDNEEDRMGCPAAASVFDPSRGL